MAILVGVETRLGVKVRKKMIASSTYGVRKYGGFHYGAGADTHGIYRVRHRWGKTIQEKMPFYFPINPKTGPQLAQQQKMTDAVVAWQALTPEQEAVYNKRAIGQEMSGYNLFLSEYLYSH